jgi:hypothetical protein
MRLRERDLYTILFIEGINDGEGFQLHHWEEEYGAQPELNDDELIDHIKKWANIKNLSFKKGRLVAETVH